MRVSDLRSILLDKGISESVVASMTKQQLEKKIKELEDQQTQEDFNLTMNLDPEKYNVNYGEDEVSEEEYTSDNYAPPYSSPEWQTYILSQFKDGDHKDGFPTCFGLRRLLQINVGPILSSKANHLSVINTTNGQTGDNTRVVTVGYEIEVEWRVNMPIVLLHGETQNIYETRVFGGIADCIEDANNVFGKHPAASAETKAESRALKKALGINSLTFEEKISGYDEKAGEMSKEEPITQSLIGFINAKINILGLDMSTLMKEKGLKATQLKDLTMDEGRMLFSHINTLQQGK